MEDFMNGSELRQRFLERLLEQIKEETFPSVTMMDLVGTGLSTREQLQEYAEVLLEKIESSRYPSIPMLERFERVVTQLDLARG
jgi:hypothetical protein